MTALVSPVLLSPHPHGGAARYEGAPLGEGSSYQVSRRHGSGYPDTLAAGGSMTLSFGKGYWKTPQVVRVRGLDDFIDDYNTTYAIAVTFGAFFCELHYFSVLGSLWSSIEGIRKFGRRQPD